MRSYKELAAMPAQNYLNPALFVTCFDGPNNAAWRARQYAKGLELATTYNEIHIAINSLWSAQKPNATMNAYEGIGYHAGTADLLRGFLAGTAKVIVHRCIDGISSKTTIKE